MAQVDALLDPTTGDAYPAEQSWQELFPAPPSTSAYVPVLQGVHVALPVSLNLPTGQMVHVEFSLAPRMGENIPAGHSVQEVVFQAVE
jgi:hypothetical protein